MPKQAKAKRLDIEIVPTYFGLEARRNGIEVLQGPWLNLARVVIVL